MRRAILYTKAVLTVLGYVLTVPAWLAHEATHYLLAHAARLDPEWVWFPGPHVSIETDGAPRDVRVIVALAPTIVGALAALVIVTTVTVTFTPWAVVLGGWWLVYTYPSTLDRRAARVAWAATAPAAEAP